MRIKKLTNRLKEAENLLLLMAVVQNPLIGKAKQSVSNFTFTSWKGRNVVKSKTFTYNDRRTDVQLDNRARLSLMSWAARAYRNALRTGFRTKATDVTEYNLFTSKAFNYPLSSTTSRNEFRTLNPKSVQLSSGNLPQMTGFSYNFNSGTGEHEVSWDLGTPGIPSDAQVMVVIAKQPRVIQSGEEYSEDVDLSFNLLSYSAGSGTAPAEGTWTNSYALAFIISTSENDVSDTQWTQHV